MIIELHHIALWPCLIVWREIRGSNRHNYTLAQCIVYTVQCTVSISLILLHATTHRCTKEYDDDKQKDQHRKIKTKIKCRASAC